tara:strand:+ start:1859 stop:2827 length:969 start_codon:yes stop_codon:yes gene_type:complete
MNVLLTGCAGFIGSQLSIKLISENIKVYGIDNLNNYYDVKLKKDRLQEIRKKDKKKLFQFKKIDIRSKKNLINFLRKKNIKFVINLAAQAGVRYSIKNPKDYLTNNVNGFFNLLEVCRELKIKNFIFASTSSVYGNIKRFPLKENFNPNRPIQFYAATKIANEVMAHSYSHLFNIKCIGLRFFTVYGPWGRPDMALFKFTENILSKKKIKVFNYGNHIRDFTYVGDIVDGVYNLIKNYKKQKKYNIFNLGNNKPIKLSKYINLIEKNLKMKSKKKYISLQKGDIVKTHSDSTLAKKNFSFLPKTTPETGIKKFVEWFIKYKS